MTESQNLSSKKKAFLSAYVQTGTVTHAARAAKIDRRTHYEWMKDPGYAREFEASKEAAAETLESEAIRRARDGVEEPVYQGGVLVGKKRRYSDTLLIFLLKGLMREKYGDQVTQRIEPPLSEDEAAEIARRYGLENYQLPGGEQ